MENDMKTQITSLINGAANIRRDLANGKYINAPKSTSVGDYSGSSNEMRKGIAKKVMAENADGMKVEILGRKYTLSKKQSTTGRTEWFSSEISQDDFELLAGHGSPISKNESKYYLTINADMTVRLTIVSRRSENAEWKDRGGMYIDESFVTIL